MKGFKPFANESDALSIGEGDLVLTVENHKDAVSLGGALDITLDKTGLANAQLLQQLLSEIVATLQAAPNLPDHIPVAPKVFKPNPF